MGARAIATLVVVALMLGGPMQPLALALQPAQDTPPQQPPAQEPTVPPPPADQTPVPTPEPAVPPSSLEPPPEPPTQQPAMQPPPVLPVPPQPPAAQQAPLPEPPPAPQPPPQQQPAAQQPDLFREALRASEPPPPRRGVDIYDVAAGFVTVAKMPFNVGLCALGGMVSATLFLVTLGSGYKASARVVEEGCRGPWLVRGDDLRPAGPRRDAGSY